MRKLSAQEYLSEYLHFLKLKWWKFFVDMAKNLILVPMLELFSSPELKAQVNFSDQNVSVVVVVVVRNIFTFLCFSQIAGKISFKLGRRVIG